MSKLWAGIWLDKNLFRVRFQPCSYKNVIMHNQYNNCKITINSNRKRKVLASTCKFFSLKDKSISCNTAGTEFAKDWQKHLHLKHIRALNQTKQGQVTSCITERTRKKTVSSLFTILFTGLQPELHKNNAVSVSLCTRKHLQA